MGHVLIIENLPNCKNVGKCDTAEKILIAGQLIKCFHFKLNNNNNTLYFAVLYSMQHNFLINLLILSLILKTSSLSNVLCLCKSRVKYVIINAF